MERNKGMYERTMKVPRPAVKFLKLTKCWDIAEVIKYGGSVGMVEMKYNVLQSTMKLIFFTKYEKSIGWRNHSYIQVSRTNVLDQWWSVLKNSKYGCKRKTNECEGVFWRLWNFGLRKRCVVNQWQSENFLSIGKKYTRENLWKT